MASGLKVAGAGDRHTHTRLQADTLLWVWGFFRKPALLPVCSDPPEPSAGRLLEQTPAAGLVQGGLFLPL